MPAWESMRKGKRASTMSFGAQSSSQAGRYMEGADLLVEELRKAHGVRVALLQEGDVITVGMVKLVFRG